MSKRLDDLVADVKDIKKEQSDTNVKLAEYNKLLDIHISATNDLRDRVKPIEDHVKFLRSLAKLIVVLSGIPFVVHFLQKIFTKA